MGEGGEIERLGKSRWMDIGMELDSCYHGLEMKMKVF